MIDFHNHLLPGVDDGAATLAETRAALQALRADGVTRVVVTPHLAGGATRRPAEFSAVMERIDSGYREVTGLVEREFAGLTLDRGVELMLDEPGIEMSDPRVRLAGSRSVLVEFPSMIVPPHSRHAVAELQTGGWRVVIAHPERYWNVRDLRVLRGWKEAGCLLQVNAGSILGRYGPQAERLAWRILREGLADCLCSDYHARGAPRLRDAVELLGAEGGAEQVRLLTGENPARLLADEELTPVPPLGPRPSWWRRFRWRRR